MNGQLGVYAFLLGIIVALLGGFLGTPGGLFGNLLAGLSGWIILLLVLLGLVVGFLNISDKEVNTFLLAAVALLAIGTVSALESLNLLYQGLGFTLHGAVRYIAVFVAPAALIVALKSVYNLGKS